MFMHIIIKMKNQEDTTTSECVQDEDGMAGCLEEYPRASECKPHDFGIVCGRGQQDDSLPLEKGLRLRRVPRFSGNGFPNMLLT